jgi:hypothetical protein
VSLIVSGLAGVRDLSRAGNIQSKDRCLDWTRKGDSLRTGNMERVAWTAIEGRQIKSARGECVLLCGTQDKVGKTSPDVRTYREPRNRE